MSKALHRMTHGQGRQEGIWEKLDPAIVTNLDSVVPQARVFGGEGVGIIAQSIGLFYRTDTFQRNGWAAPSLATDPTPTCCSSASRPTGCRTPTRCGGR